ncbi:MAG TPA: LptF/LptG family permease [Anaeromyxobacteraceae bacterium]|nr:LptF/LptG family permease [Anaeromyxobacteraceae bacterium]
MTQLDRYLAREILLPFAAGLVFLTQLLLATQVFARAEVLFGSGVSAGDVLSVTLALLPHFVGYVLPVAFLLGATVGVARLAEDREVIALGAAGVSPLRLVRVPLGLGLAVGALGIWSALWLEPVTLGAARERLNEIVKKNVRSDVRAGTFFDGIPGYIFYAERVSGGEWENVLIHDRSSPETPVLALASGGRLEPVGTGQEMRLALDAGEVHREDLSSADYLVATFRRATLTIGLGSVLTDRANVGRGNVLTLDEARERARPAPGRRPEEVRRAAAALQRRIAAPRATIPVALLAVPLGTWRRGGRAFAVGATLFGVLAHYLLLRGGEVLAVAGALPAAVALQLPLAVLGTLALVLLGLLARRGAGAVR